MFANVYTLLCLQMFTTLLLHSLQVLNIVFSIHLHGLLQGFRSFMSPAKIFSPFASSWWTASDSLAVPLRPLHGGP